VIDSTDKEERKRAALEWTTICEFLNQKISLLDTVHTKLKRTFVKAAIFLPMKTMEFVLFIVNLQITDNVEVLEATRSLACQKSYSRTTLYRLMFPF